MTNEELEAILSMGGDEEAISELLRQADRQEGIADDTRGKEYLINAGRVNVANPWGAVSDMFVRGNAEKKAEKARGEATNARAQMDQTKVKDFFRAANNQGLGGVDLGAPGPIQPPTKFPMPQAPQVGPAPGAAPAGPAGPMGPPAPAAPVPPPAPPGPPAPVAPPAPPKPPRPPGPVHPLGASMFGPGEDDEGMLKSLMDMLARRGGGVPGGGGV